MMVMTIIKSLMMNISVMLKIAYLFLIFIIIIINTAVGVNNNNNNNIIFEINIADDPQPLFISAPELLILENSTINSRKFDPEESCRICESVIANIISLRKSNASRDVMIDYLGRLCTSYTSQTNEVCTGTVLLQVDTILYIIDHREDLKAARFCAIYFQSYNCTDPNADEWIIPLPPSVPSNDLPIKMQLKNDAKSDILHILHLTDVHLDPFYTPGSNSKCSEPLCCETGVPKESKDAAGFWGDYGVCDMPWHTMDNMMERIKTAHKNLDYLYFTGDIVSHRNWVESNADNAEVITQFLSLLNNTFPNLTVFPILGNHEANPVDFYSPESVEKSSNVSIQWLFNLSAELWSKWLPNDTQTTIKKGGFYTVLVKSGFRIIALNSNVCYTANLWLVYENKDTYSQLKWLVEVLTEAEKNGEKVHILSHIPSGDDVSSCVKVWSREFKNIILRFSDTISAIFNGHTHQVEFKLYFDSNNNTKDVKLVAYNGGSFTTFVGSNPNYRIYNIDSDNLTVTDYSEYTFNLTEANLNSKVSPQWYQLYSFKEKYGLNDLSSTSLVDLYSRLKANNSNNEFVYTYFKNMYRNSDYYLQRGCDAECKHKIVCLIGAEDTSESILC